MRRDNRPRGIWWLRLPLKLTLSAGLLALAVWMVGPERVADDLRALSWGVVLFALPVMSVGILVTVRRWQVILADQGAPLRLGLLLRLYLGGLFFNTLGLGGVGGYIYRIARLSRYTGGGAIPAASLLADRGMDVVSLVVIGLVGLAALAASRGAHGAAVALGGGAVAAAVLSWLVFDRGRSMLVGSSRRLERARAGSVLGELLGAIARVADRPGMALRLLGLSVLFQSAMIGSNYAISWVLDLRIPLLYFVALMPLVAIFVNVVPAALGGLGSTQAAYVYFFGLAGVEGGKALTLSLVVTAAVLLLSLVGGGVCGWDWLRSSFPNADTPTRQDEKPSTRPTRA